MARAYASGKYALGFCDRCGWQYLLSQLKQERQNEVLSSFLVCPTCWDPDHPQNKAGRMDYSDAVGLYESRPDAALQSSRSLAGFNPVRGFSFSIYLGRVTIQ